VKPSNILLEEGRRVLLTDFGLAKMVEGSLRLTGTGIGLGTPAYISPEQGRGAEVDARTDVYALGVVLYEMVTGQVPYKAETPMAVILKHINEPLPPPRTINPHLPESVERVILKALAKDKESRYASAGEMAAALRQAVTQPGSTFIPAPPPASVTRPSPPATTTWQAPPASATRQSPPATTTWQPPPVYPPAPPPYGGMSPVATPHATRSTQYVPWALVGGGIAVLLLLAGLVGLFIIGRGRWATPTPTAPVFVPVTRPVSTTRPTNTPESPEPPQFGKITFALGYSKDKLAPVNPASSFAQGVTEIHAVFEYSGMSNGDAWERVLYRDGKEVLRKSAQWNGGKKGVFDYFINTQGEPLTAGNWRLELYVGGQLLSQGSFTVE
jgi:serine/threonine protein kinase